jgi:hypothetical protein
MGFHRLLVVGFASFAGLTAQSAKAADAEHPAVVELFQSQGCNSCPPAIANLNALASRSDVLALTFAVDYWDYLGWKDTFAKHKFTERQWQYAHSLGHNDVFTPQVVVNGRADGVGVASGEIENLIASAPPPGAAPNAHIVNGQLSIAAAQNAHANAEVWVAFYDPRTIDVPIARGENAGHTIAHRNVVRDVVLAGKWHGGAETIDLPPPPQGLLRAVLVQSSGTGPILLAIRG